MHMYNFLCSNSLLYFFLFLSTLHSVYTCDCSYYSTCACTIIISIMYNNYINNVHVHVYTIIISCIYNNYIMYIPFDVITVIKKGNFSMTPTVCVYST